MAKQNSTQEIPAWSANITANGPKDMRDALNRQAVALGISLGELQRQFWIIAARAKFPALAKELIAAHKRYYPTRQLMAGFICLFTLLGGSVGQFAVAHGHHNHDQRHSRMAMRSAAKSRQDVTHLLEPIFYPRILSTDDADERRFL